MALNEKLEKLQELAQEIVAEFEDGNAGSPQDPTAKGNTNGILIMAVRTSEENPENIMASMTLLGAPSLVAAGVDNLFERYPIIPQLIAQHKMAAMMGGRLEDILSRIADQEDGPEGEPVVHVVHPGNDTEN